MTDSRSPWRTPVRRDPAAPAGGRSGGRSSRTARCRLAADRVAHLVPLQRRAFRQADLPADVHDRPGVHRRRERAPHGTHDARRKVHVDLRSGCCHPHLLDDRARRALRRRVGDARPLHRAALLSRSARRESTGRLRRSAPHGGRVRATCSGPIRSTSTPSSSPPTTSRSRSKRRASARSVRTTSTATGGWSASSHTNSLTNGSATASASRSGRTSGSTRVSPATRNGSGRSTPAGRRRTRRR